MKRLTYISKMRRFLSDCEIRGIGTSASKNNFKMGITGVLVYFRGLFFQIIEGEDEAIDRMYDAIQRDERHTDILCLKTEYDIEHRLFPQWSMNVINLDDNTDVLMQPIKLMLHSITESHSIIEQYTQPSVLKIINRGVNPLTVPTRKVEKIILFADIVSFSAISESLPVEQIALLINRYLEISSNIITEKGGELTKFIGDCVMAYFSPELADNAVQACLDILGELKKERTRAEINSPVGLLYCGLGLSQGVVIEGNMGSSIKTDYTILGDPVNTAARLEALTRDVKKAIIVSETVKSSTQLPWDFVSIGKHDLKGKEKNAELFSVNHDLVNDFDVKKRISIKLKNILSRSHL